MSDYSKDPGWPTMLTVAQDIANGMTREEACWKASQRLADKVDYDAFQKAREYYGLPAWVRPVEPTC